MLKWTDGKWLNQLVKCPKLCVRHNFWIDMFFHDVMSRCDKQGRQNTLSYISIDSSSVWVLIHLWIRVYRTWNLWSFLIWLNLENSLLWYKFFLYIYFWSKDCIINRFMLYWTKLYALPSAEHQVFLHFFRIKCMTTILLNNKDSL